MFLMLFGSPICLFGQLKWASTPIVTDIGDSITYELNTKLYYDYFYQRFDSVMVGILNIEKGVASAIKQKVVVNKKTGKGYLLIIYNNRILTKYQIEKNNINGLGMQFNSLLEDASKIPFQQGYFKNGKLDGFYSYLDWDTGIIKAILFYKVGAFKQVIYAEDYNKKYWKKTHTYPGL